MPVNPQRLKDARKRAGIRQQAKLAALSGVSLGTIQAYEKGKVDNPNRAILQTIAEVLGCSVSYLTDQKDLDEDQPEPASSLESSSNSNNIITLPPPTS